MPTLVRNHTAMVVWAQKSAALGAVLAPTFPVLSRVFCCDVILAHVPINFATSKIMSI